MKQSKMANLNDQEVLKQLEAQLIADNIKLEACLHKYTRDNSEDDTDDESGENEKSTDKSSRFILFKLKPCVLRHYSKSNLERLLRLYLLYLYFNIFKVMKNQILKNLMRLKVTMNVLSLPINFL